MRERRDISPRGIRTGLLIIGAGIAASLALAWLMLGISATPAAGANGFTPPPIQGPVLQVAPHDELASYKREKSAQLERTDPVDGAPGRHHLPIERAMQRLAR